MRILVSCANGAGTSLMMEMKVKQAFKELGIGIREIRHCPISEGKSIAKNFDVIFCSSNFVDMFKDAEAKGVKVIGMKNVLSVQEAKDKIKEMGIE